MTVTERTDYRIVSKAPGSKRFVYRSFTYSRSSDLERIEKWLWDNRSRYGDKGWEFKLQKRRVRVELTDWKDAR